MTNTPTEPFLIGIVTVLYNSDEVLPEFFASLGVQTGVRFRLYVIDNGSTDSGAVLSRALAKQYGIDAVVVYNNANVGVAKGNNQGIESALADGCTHVLLANNDTVFSSDTIAELLRALSDGERVSTPKIMYHSKPDRLWFAGGDILELTMRTPHYGIGQLDNGQFDRVTHVGYAPTCFMMVAADVFDIVGRMDERFFVYYDDTDFIWRMKKSGIRIRFVSNSVVFHKVSTSTGGGKSPFTLYYINRNRLYFIRKNLRGWRRSFALAYTLTTRLPRLGLLRPKLGIHGWRGIVDGFRMSVSGDAT